MRAPEHCLDQLRAAGLLVGEPFISTHLAFPDGVTVGKPTTTRGNCLPGYRCLWGMSGLVVDAPCPRLHYRDGKWLVTMREWIPGPGPGDFVNAWDTPEEAVADILDYFFGDPGRMRAGRDEDETDHGGGLA